MHLERGIVNMDIWSHGLLTRPYDQNSLTCQYSGADDSPRDPFTALLHSSTFMIAPRVLNKTYVFILLHLILVSPLKIMTYIYYRIGLDDKFM